MSNSILRLSKHAALVGIGCLMSSTAFAELTRVTVQIENVAPMQGTFTTPVWVGLHDGNAFDTYNGNTPANSRPTANSLAMESLCEDGSTRAISDDFAFLQPNSQQATVPGPNGPIAPGDMTQHTFFVDSNDPEARYFSYASMVLPSNDFCISNGNPKAHQIFDAAGNFVGDSFFVAGSETLDAGTEVNDELPANTAFFGQAAPNTGVDENGNIGTIGSDFPDASGFNPRGSGGILDDPRFSEGDFLLNGYSFLKFKFTAEPAVTDELFFNAVLRGRNVAPPVRTRTIAVAQVNLVENGGVFEVLAAVARLRRHIPVSGATMHMGAEGENGPVVVDLLAASQFTNSRFGIRHLSAQVTEADLLGPLAGLPLDALTAQMQAGNLYLKISTPRNPDGVVRGQLDASDGTGFY